MKKHYFVLFSLLFVGSVTYGQDPELVRDYYDGDGVINVIAADSANHMAYIVGTFSYFNSRTPYGAKLDATTGYSDVCYAKPNNAVRAAVSDGNGGWYIGGDFTMVGDSARNHLAHLDVAGKVLAWNPNVNGNVVTMVLSGPKLYIGGYFTTVGTQTRNYIAAINTTTALANSWDPNADGYVFTILVDGATVYAGGYFTNIGLMPRNYLAAIDTTYGIALGWNPSPSNVVNTIAINGQYLRVGGAFSYMGSDIRSYITKIDKISGTTYNITGFNGSVYSIAVSGGYAYVAGDFDVSTWPTNTGSFCRVPL